MVSTKVRTERARAHLDMPRTGIARSASSLQLAPCVCGFFAAAFGRVLLHYL